MSGCHTKAAPLIKALAEGEIVEFSQLRSLRKVSEKHGMAGVYLHFGYPTAIDGPLLVPDTTLLCYIGSGQALKKGHVARTGVARRVLEQHLVRNHTLLFTRI